MHESPNRAKAIGIDNCRPGNRGNRRSAQCQANTMPSVHHNLDSVTIGQQFFHKPSGHYQIKTDPLWEHLVEDLLNRDSNVSIAFPYPLPHSDSILSFQSFEERNNRSHFSPMIYFSLQATKVSPE